MGVDSLAVPVPELQAPFLHALPVIKRTGTLWTAVAHIITAVIGSGVLSLAWSMAQLGWIAGPLAMLFFASVTLLSTFLLSDCYRYPDPAESRNRSYIEAVHATLGKRNALVSGFFSQACMYGAGIAHTVTSATSMRTIQKSICLHTEGHGSAACEYGSTSIFILLFGTVQVVLSQIPDFHNIQWLSIVAAVMSFAYSIVGLALGFAKVIENGYVKGSTAGIIAYGASDKAWINISQALGDIVFAYPFSLVLFEIQDTLRSPPSENKTMKKASTIALIVTTFLYLCCGGFGYAAFGEETPGHIFTGFEYFEPYWIINFANACIVVHLVGAYQICSCQPIYATIEKSIDENDLLSSRSVNKNVTYKLPCFPAFQLNLLRFCLRTIYVLSTTMIAMFFPYFNQIIGLIGAVLFWPLTIHFPVEMHFKRRNIEAWTRKWIMLRAFEIVCFFVTAFTLVGSIEGLIGARLS